MHRNFKRYFLVKKLIHVYADRLKCQENVYETASFVLYVFFVSEGDFYIFHLKRIMLYRKIF